MITLGIILLIAGFLLKISILWTLGIVALVVGAILAILGSTGRAIGGSRVAIAATQIGHSQLSRVIRRRRRHDLNMPLLSGVSQDLNWN
jgi:membrane protein implicated in regulation of membrane protease activity